MRQQLLTGISCGAMAIALTATGPQVSRGQVPVVGKLFTQRVSASPESEYTLTEEQGPWMVLAASFGGEEGVAQAKELALELRRDHNLPAFTYSTVYDFTGTAGKGAIPGMNMKYANGRKYDATVVLVGDFVSSEDERVKELLERIRYIHPKALDYSKTGKTAQRFAALRAYAKRVTGDDKAKGPMASAFVTRNPLLPDEYFTAPVVDGFVRQLNSGVEHSLLNCKGKFTVVVGTFEGASTVDFGSGSKASNLDTNETRLDKAANAAHNLTTALRKEGVDAYEFHDRYRSLVTIGGFDRLGESTGDGRFIYDAKILEVMEKYSAGGKGMTPYGQGMTANGRAGIPFDLQPNPIAVPRSDKMSIYKGNWLSSR
jgi:hypothetical protein